MRFDKLTTKFQQAIADAQSVAVGRDHQYIEPAHLLLALLNQDDGATASLLQRAGANVAPLKNRSKRRCRASRPSKAMAARCRSGAT
jgi:ATP-dependent Clp protease ATP-binding subunit ClpB